MKRFWILVVSLSLPSLLKGEMPMPVVQAGNHGQEARAEAGGQKKDLFEKGELTYRLSTRKGAEVELVLLNGSTRQRTLALALTRGARSMEENEEIKERLPVENKITMKVLGLVVLLPPEEAKKPFHEQRLKVRLVGDAFEGEFTTWVNRRDFEAGKTVEVSRSVTRSIPAVATVSGTNAMKFHRDPLTGQLVVEELNASLNVSALFVKESDSKTATDFVGTPETITRRPLMK